MYLNSVKKGEFYNITTMSRNWSDIPVIISHTILSFTISQICYKNLTGRKFSKKFMINEWANKQVRIKASEKSNKWVSE